MAGRHGGIGRRAGLKIPFPQGSAGSTPAAGSKGAKELLHICAAAFFVVVEYTGNVIE